jgi:hypothetical protein
MKRRAYNVTVRIEETYSVMAWNPDEAEEEALHDLANDLANYLTASDAEVVRTELLEGE